jgi:hypothetical protein
VHQGFATKETILESSARPVFVTMEVDDDVTHHDFAGIVERLSKIFVSVDLFGFVIRSDRKNVHG